MPHRTIPVKFDQRMAGQGAVLDIDAIGGAATAGLVAKAIETPTGETGEHKPECADCGTVTVGRFCHVCGNPAHVHRTLLHLGEELLHGVMHFDSRTWRTLPLLVFRPGRLTREWVMGKRSRYVSPLALFLFTIFIMFMAISYLPNPKATAAEQRIAAAAALSKANTQMANAQGALQKSDTSGARHDAEGEIRDAMIHIKVSRAALQGAAVPQGGGEDWQKQLAAAVESGRLKINTGDKDLDEKLKEKLANPELTIYKLQQAFYKFSFLLVPISIPFVALLFVWKKGFTLYDHGVFVLYSLTFMSLLVMVLATMSKVGGAVEAVAMIGPFLVPVHMFFQLKGAYALTTGSALWRTFFLVNFSFVALSLFIAAILWFETKV